MTSRHGTISTKGQNVARITWGIEIRLHNYPRLPSHVWKKSSKLHGVEIEWSTWFSFDEGVHNPCFPKNRVEWWYGAASARLFLNIQPCIIRRSVPSISAWPVVQICWAKNPKGCCTKDLGLSYLRAVSKVAPVHHGFDDDLKWLLLEKFPLTMAKESLQGCDIPIIVAIAAQLKWNCTLNYFALDKIHSSRIVSPLWSVILYRI